MCDTNGIGTMHICVLFRHQAKCNREDCMGQCYIALHASYTCSNRSLRESFGCIDRDQINRFNAMSWLTNVTFSERFACEIWYKTLNATDVTTFCFACSSQMKFSLKILIWFCCCLLLDAWSKENRFFSSPSFKRNLIRKEISSKYRIQSLRASLPGARISITRTALSF